MLVPALPPLTALCLLPPGDSCRTDGTYAYDADFSCCSSLWVPSFSGTPLWSPLSLHKQVAHLGILEPLWAREGGRK